MRLNYSISRTKIDRNDKRGKRKERKMTEIAKTLNFKL
jgi:hypothetical protein